MADSGIRHKFLSERKKTVQQEVAKVRTEYTAILDYLHASLDQVTSRAVVATAFTPRRCRDGCANIAIYRDIAIILTCCMSLLCA